MPIVQVHATLNHFPGFFVFTKKAGQYHVYCAAIGESGYI